MAVPSEIFAAGNAIDPTVRSVTVGLSGESIVFVVIKNDLVCFKAKGFPAIRCTAFFDAIDLIHHPALPELFNEWSIVKEVGKQLRNCISLS